MTTLLTFFYCLPMEWIALGFVIATMLFLRICRSFGHKQWFRPGVGILLAAWFCAVLWITILKRSPGSVYTPELVPFHSYRKLMATGIREIARANFMNVALFFPAGLLTASLLPEHRPCWLRFLMVTVLFSLFSAAIEYAQYHWTLGEPEIDDVIHNTLGALLGALPVFLKTVRIPTPQRTP